MDLTDESYYFLWIDQPASYLIAGSAFGHFLSPVYRLFDSDPAALRRFGLLALMLFAAGFSLAVTARSRTNSLADKCGGWLLALACAGTTVTYYFVWLPTPSYNWLPLPAAFLLLTGLVLIYNKYSDWLSALAIGAAGLLAFAGKPTTAVGFALVYGCGVLILRGFTRHALLHVAQSTICCVALFLLAAGTFLDAPLAIEQARSYIEVFGATPAAGGGFIQGAVGPVGYYVALAAAVASFRLPPQKAKICGVVAAVAAVSVLVSRLPAYGVGQGAIAMTVSLAAVANCLAWAPTRPDWRLLAIVSLGHMLPWICAFGTGNTLLFQSSFYVSLPLCAAIMTAYLCFGGRDWRTMAVALLATFFAFAALYAADRSPYRIHAGLNSQEHSVPVGGGLLRVDAPTRDFIENLRRQAAAAGFSPGSVVLDFSGELPGAALVLGGRAPYFPWLVNGYDFSERLASAAVAQLNPDDRKQAWIVRSDAPRTFTAAFVTSLGSDLDKDYKIVATALHPLYGRQVILYAPVDRAQ
ncbi:hypothetical protein [Hyphomicrobium sp. D-2]|uniref:hypothetical protein n=1 Tax=Hyphomicrobium sp. D-2 TaxID=3041621 RepID=UPI002457FE8A|nr:hypothetical protein [Hyphomicrobium sp. D-2]MDH4981862.1 hypothetical protein [Hyphomicrobium sp. D-2]